MRNEVGLPESHRPEGVGRNVVLDIIKLSGDVFDFVVEFFESVGLSFYGKEALAGVLDVAVNNNRSGQWLLESDRESPSSGKHSERSRNRESWFIFRCLYWKLEETNVEET